jgi:hypothetical protein
MNWDPMRDLSQINPVLVLNWFNEKVIKSWNNLCHCRKREGKVDRECAARGGPLWRRLAKIKTKIKLDTNIQKLTKMMQDGWNMEKQLRDDYTASNNMEEDKAVFNIEKSEGILHLC